MSLGRTDLPPIVCTWKLISCQFRKDDGDVVYPFGEHPGGSLIYTDSGQFSIQVMRTDRPHFASGDQMTGTPDEIEKNYKGTVSYFGAYEFNKEQGFVVHNVKGSLFPNWEGQAQKRFFEITENRLKLFTPPTIWGEGEEIVGELVWEKVDSSI